MLIVFTEADSERVKSAPPKEGSHQELILVIFGISDPLKRVIKIIYKVAQCIYTRIMGLYLYVSILKVIGLGRGS